MEPKGGDFKVGSLLLCPSTLLPCKLSVGLKYPSFSYQLNWIFRKHFYRRLLPHKDLTWVQHTGIKIIRNPFNNCLKITKQSKYISKLKRFTEDNAIMCATNYIQRLRLMIRITLLYCIYHQLEEKLKKFRTNKFETMEELSASYNCGLHCRGGVSITHVRTNAYYTFFLHVKMYKLEP